MTTGNPDAKPPEPWAAWEIVEQATDISADARKLVRQAAEDIRPKTNWLLDAEMPGNAPSVTMGVDRLLVELVTKHNPDADQLRQCFDVLTILIEAGNREGRWTECAPLQPIVARRDSSGPTPERFALISTYRDIRDRFRERLLHFRELPPGEQAGALFCAAALEGGLATTSSLHALSIVLGQRLQRAGGQAYLDFPLRGPGDTNVRRWFLPHLCELIYLAMPPEAIEAGRNLTGFMAHRRIRDLLCPPETCRKQRYKPPKRVGDWVQAMQANHDLKLAGLLREYALNRTVSASLHPHVLPRLWGQRPPHPEAPKEKPGPEDRQPRPVPQDPSDETYTVRQRDRWLDALYESLRVSDGQPLHAPAMKHRLRDLMSEDYDGPAIGRLLAEWLLYRLAGKANSPFRRSTLYSYLTTAGRRIYGLAGGNDVALFTQDEFTSLYSEVLESAVSNRHRSALRRVCSDFQNFLADTYEAPPSQTIDALRNDVGGHYIDANLIGFDEYEAVLAALARRPVDADLLEIATLLTILAFRCGFRRNELIKLRIEDLQGNTEPEVLVRPFPGRTLKTGNARRRVPIHALLSAEELARVLRWRDRRIAETRDQEDTRFLFHIEGSGRPFVDQEVVIPLIHAVMRDVTGDVSLRFHHFRHACASWLLLGLMTADTPLSMFDDLPATSAWLHDAHLLRNRLYQHTNPDMAPRKRPHAYLVARLLGHAGPEVTLENYMHWADLLLHAALRRSSTEIPAAIQAVLMERRVETVYRNQADATATRLLDKAHRHSERGAIRPRPTRSRRASEAPNAVEATLFERLSTTWNLLYQAHEHDVPGDVLADRFNRSRSDVDALLRRATEWQARQTRGADTPNLPGYPSALRKAAEKQFAQTLCSLVATVDTEETAWAVAYFAEHSWTSRNALIFREHAPAQRFLDWLRAMRMPWSAIRLVHYRGSLGRSQAAVELRAWRKALNLGRRIPIVQQVYAQRSLGPHGWLRLNVSDPASPGSDEGNYGFRFVMAMLWIGQYNGQNH